MFGVDLQKWIENSMILIEVESIGKVTSLSYDYSVVYRRALGVVGVRLQVRKYGAITRFFANYRKTITTDSGLLLAVFYGSITRPDDQPVHYWCLSRLVKR